MQALFFPGLDNTPTMSQKKIRTIAELTHKGKIAVFSVRKLNSFGFLIPLAETFRRKIAQFGLQGNRTDLDLGLNHSRHNKTNLHQRLLSKEGKEKNLAETFQRKLLTNSHHKGNRTPLTSVHHSACDTYYLSRSVRVLHCCTTHWAQANVSRQWQLRLLSWT